MNGKSNSKIGKFYVKPLAMAVRTTDKTRMEKYKMNKNGKHSMLSIPTESNRSNLLARRNCFMVMRIIRVVFGIFSVY